MSGCCRNDHCDAPVEDGARKALWIAVVINAGMFLVELSAGLAGGSAGLQADAMDFMGDAASYGISLAVLSMAAVWRTRAAMLKGTTMMLFGFWVAGTIVYHWQTGTVPSYELMGGIGLAAMAANIVCAVILFRFRGTDANMRSVWLCTRNDVLSNIAIVIAASGVWVSGSGLPDLIVAAIIAGLAFTGAVDILKRVRQEFRDLAPVGGD